MASLFAPAPEPPTELGRYRVLASTAGIRVSPLQLGAMSIGSAWAAGMGEMTKESSFALLDAFAAAGGNFIDTANNYHNGESEEWIGEWMAARKNRDQMVIATKYTADFGAHLYPKGTAPNHSGNSKRSLQMSVRDSLKKLQTETIDILYVHGWDWTTSIEEIVDALDVLVKQGKVLYLGISNTPAWIVALANSYAKANGRTQFSIYQGCYSVLMRDLEREILPLCRHFGMAIAPWGAMGGGKLQTRKARDARQASGEGLRKIFGDQQSELEEKMSDALAKVAEEHGIESVTAIALAYVMSKAPNVFPLVGGRKVEQLQDNIQALKIRLTPEQIAFLESVKPLDPGYPSNLIGENPAVTGVAGPMIAASTQMAFVKGPQAIGYN